MSEKAIGIVAEYNPLHNGHLYQIQQSRELSGAHDIVIVLSSHFVQRGEPAFLDKWTRSEMALLAGADLVIELPTIYSCHNAGVFANAAIDLLKSTGIVEYVSFGMETPTLLVNTISDILIQEPDPFKFLLRSFLNMGFSFVEARAKSLEELVPGAADFLTKPNNSLALSYVKRIRESNYSLKVIPVKRISSHYHEENLQGSISSATSIRTATRKGQIQLASESIPGQARSLFVQNIISGRALLSMDIFWRILKTIILRSEPDTLAGYAEISEGVEHLFKKMAPNATSWEELVNSCISRRYPRGRVQRNLIHILLGIDHWDNRSFQRLGPAYIRILGANKKGKAMIRKMRKTATLPVITRASAPYSPYARKMMDLEHRAGAIWELLIESPVTEHEKKRIPLMM